jgi:hypothetical protein
MDPNACVSELVGLATGLVTQLDRGVMASEDDVTDLVNMVVNLDAWIVNGGFLPERWNRS